MATVLSAGADTQSRNFYLRLKGETDAALAALGFERLDVFRPGLLREPRGRDRRLGERIGIAASYPVNPLLLGPLDCYAVIDADRVAAAIAAGLVAPRPGLPSTTTPRYATSPPDAYFCRRVGNTSLIRSYLPKAAESRGVC